MQAAELKPVFYRNFVACVPGTHGNPLIGWCTRSLFSGADVYQSNCLSFGPLPIFILRLFVHYMVSRRGILLLLFSWYMEKSRVSVPMPWTATSFVTVVVCNMLIHTGTHERVARRWWVSSIVGSMIMRTRVSSTC
jgi:hypothetical protein